MLHDNLTISNIYNIYDSGYLHYWKINTTKKFITIAPINFYFDRLL